MAISLDGLAPLDDPVPDDVRSSRGLPGVAEAFEEIHRPRAKEQWQRARDRFRFEEAFVLQTVFAQRRHALERDPATARPTVAGGLRERFAERLPFRLTAGQEEVADVIVADLDAREPMGRLFQGEVGSGKTVVALLAMLRSSTPADRRPCSLRRRCSPGSTLAPSPSSWALGGRDTRGGRGATRVRCSPGRSAPRPASRRWWTPPPATPASSWVLTH